MTRVPLPVRARLELEAEAISTALGETIRRSHQRAVAEASRWEPAPMPEGWQR